MGEHDFSNLHRLLGWAMCKLARKHKRGKRIDTDLYPHDWHTYQCSRCLATWLRKIRKVKKEE